MASPTAAMLRILRTRRAESPPRPQAFDEYEHAYRSILVEIRALGGDPAIDALTAWITARTRATGRLPPPAQVRAQARRICTEQGVTVPPESPLHPAGGTEGTQSVE